MTAPITLNVHAQDLSGSEQAKLRAYLKRLQPSAVLIMDGFNLAVEIKHDLPECEVILRDNNTGGNDGAHRHFTPQQVVQGYKRAFDAGLVAYVENEQEWSVRHLGWLVDVANAAHQRGGRCCLGNFTVGQPEPDVITSGRVDELIKVCIEQEHYFGLHEYALETLHWREGYPWLVGRFMELVRRHRDIAGGDPATAPPWIMFTEWGWDGDKKGDRGILAYLPKWQAQGHTDPQFHAFEQIRDVWNEVYAPSGVIAGVCLFSYGAVVDHWRDYDFRGTPRLLDMLADYEWRWPVDNLAGLYITGGVAVNVRSSPAGTQVGVLAIGTQVQLTGTAQVARMNGVDYTWRQMSNGKWFAHVAALTLAKVEPPPPPIPDPPEDDDLEDLRQLFDAFQAIEDVDINGLARAGKAITRDLIDARTGLSAVTKDIGKIAALIEKK